MATATQPLSAPVSLIPQLDFVLPGEEAEYARHCSAFLRDLSPLNILEEVFASEIISAAWRLRRCSRVESQLADAALADPMSRGSDDNAARTQLFLDRARSQAHNILRRSMAELRRLQTDREINDSLSDGQPADPAIPRNLAATKEVIRAMASAERLRMLSRKANGLDTFDKLLDRATAPPAFDPPFELPHCVPPAAGLGSFCKNPAVLPEAA